MPGATASRASRLMPEGRSGSLDRPHDRLNPNNPFSIPPFALIPRICCHTGKSIERYTRNVGTVGYLCHPGERSTRRPYPSRLCNQPPIRLLRAADPTQNVWL